MDFFQGTSPPNFISFCLDNHNVNETQTPSNPALEIPAESSQPQLPTRTTQPDTPTEQDSGRLNFVTLEASPGSIDSQTDVNVYSEAMVRRLESSQTSEKRVAPVRSSFRRARWDSGVEKPKEIYSSFILKLGQYLFPT